MSLNTTDYTIAAIAILVIFAMLANYFSMPGTALAIKVGVIAVAAFWAIGIRRERDQNRKAAAATPAAAI